ncbi:MAG: tyrosine-type recombinase/integrase [Solirubrobacteraceae bacterium]
MLCERGASEGTFVRFEPDARMFLSERLGASGLDLAGLMAADVSSFLARECPRRSVAGARYLVTVLRSLLRYLHVAGLIAMPLQWAVPGVADLRDRSLPRGLDPATVKRLLAGCDRRRTVGRRDYAILLLMVRLGLRACEVAAIRLEDLDWRRGELIVRGKGGRIEPLPLPGVVPTAVTIASGPVGEVPHRHPHAQRRTPRPITLRAAPPRELHQPLRCQLIHRQPLARHPPADQLQLPQPVTHRPRRIATRHKPRPIPRRERRQRPRRHRNPPRRTHHCLP